MIDQALSMCGRYTISRTNELEAWFNTLFLSVFLSLPTGIPTLDINNA